MRSFIGSTLAVVGLAVLPALTLAQRRAAARTDAHAGAQHEFGVDLSADYVSPSGGTGGIEILTPVDVRIGFHSKSPLMWEGRLNFLLSSVGGAGTAYAISPGVAALYAMGPGGHSSGMFLSGGAGLVLAGSPAVSGTSVSLGASIGWRKPYGSGAFRYEAGFRYDTQNNALGPATFRIGGRVGISLWH
jgi:hypothetical protein